MTLCTHAKGAQCVCQPDDLMFCPHDPHQHELRKLAGECGAEEYMYGKHPPRLVVEFEPQQLNAFVTRIQAHAAALHAESRKEDAESCKEPRACVTPPNSTKGDSDAQA